MKTWIVVWVLVCCVRVSMAISIKPPPTSEEVKKTASFIGIVEVVEVPKEPAAGFWGDKPPVVKVKVVESWKGMAKDGSYGYLWDSDFRPEALMSWNSEMMPGGPAAVEKGTRITLPMAGDQLVVFAEARGEGVWRDIYGWKRRPIVQKLPVGHPDQEDSGWWSSDSDHCLRTDRLEEIARTRNYYGRQKFVYRSEPDDVRTRSCLRYADVTQAGAYWVLTSDTAVKMLVTAVEPNPGWPVRYTVQKGDTLSRIAERFYRDEARWKDVAKANGLKDAAKIRERMVLAIPPVGDDR